MGTLFTEQLRAAIKEHELSRYALWQATGIDQASLSRFVQGKGGLSLEAVDKLVDALDLELVVKSSLKPDKSSNRTRKPK